MKEDVKYTIVLLIVMIVIVCLVLKFGSPAPDSVPNDKTAEKPTVYAPVDGTNTEATPPEVSADLNVYSCKAKQGDTVEIPVVLSKNPGVVSIRLSLQYDSSAMTLVTVRDGGIISGNDSSNIFTSVPYVLSWANDTATENFTNTGRLATLVFRIKDDATSGTYPIELSYNRATYDIIDVAMDSVNIDIANGTITVTD